MKKVTNTELTETQKKVMAKLLNGGTIVLDYRNPNGIKMVTLESLKKKKAITYERVSAPHLKGSAKAYKITIL